jgi:uncharacterized protein YeaO (DUF488 family)
MNKLYVTNKDRIYLLPVDCIRLCIARQPFPNMDNIYHALTLAPSDKLWRDFIKHKSITWDEYVIIFKKEMIQMENSLKVILKHLNSGKDIALICHCKLSIHCHRGILAEYFKEKGIEIIYI